jgi:phosphoglycerol transferase MdoB-like AlkP superfamily enzyme
MIGRFFQHPAFRGRYAAAAGLYALIWTVELWLVQYFTLVPPQANSTKFTLFAQGVRLVCDAVFCFGAASVLPRFGRYATALLACFVELGLVTYADYFRRPFSLLTAVSQFQEGAAYAADIFTLIPTGWAAFLIAALIAKLACTYVGGRGPAPYRRRVAAGAAVAAYAVLMIALSMIDPLSKARDTRGLSRLGIMRGYTPSWIAEFWYLSGDSARQQALAEKANVTDRLTSLESPVPVGRLLVVLQVETFGWELANRRIDGVEITPFWNRLAEESMYYRVRALRYNGSADADFCVLSGYPPYSKILNYNLPSYPFDDSWPRFLKAYGFKTYSFVSDPGQFYNRRQNYERIGFDEISFKEELVEKYAVRSHELGVPDGDLFTVSLLRIREHLRDSTEPLSHFVMTGGATHFPFSTLLDSEKELYPGSHVLRENYFNSFRYFDNRLRDYIAGLPLKTTLVIYGDHPAGSEVANGDFAPDRDANGEYVPCLIHVVGENIRPLQKTRDTPQAFDGSLTMVDVMNYVRNSVKAARESKAFGR